MQRLAAYPTPFVRVTAMNVAFGNPHGALAGETEAEKLAHIKDFLLKNLRKEMEELERAETLSDARDALCDWMVYTLGAYGKLGLDADADMAEVVRCLMSRLVRDAQHERETVDYWAALGVATYTEPVPFPRAVKSACDQPDNNGDYHPKGKFLKAVGYEQPVLR